MRYETAPGQQLQIDFGSTAVAVGGEIQRIHLFVATLGYSRRCYVAVFLHERQSAWLQGLEGAFRHFAGVPQEVLLDNARALVTEHNVQTREVKFNDRFHVVTKRVAISARPSSSAARSCCSPRSPSSRARSPWAPRSPGS